MGALSKTVQLKPRESKEITFIISWYFPNLVLPQNKNSKGENKGRFYSKRFKNAAAVAADGVPVISPVELLNAKPVGSAGLTEYVIVPPPVIVTLFAVIAEPVQ